MTENPITRKPLTHDERRHMRLGIAALRANPVKAKGRMRDKKTGGRCCLCVLHDVAVANAAFLDCQCACDSLPPEASMRWFGLEGSVPSIAYKGGYRDMTALNDGSVNAPALSHKAIADALEKAFPEARPCPGLQKAKGKVRDQPRRCTWHFMEAFVLPYIGDPTQVSWLYEWDSTLKHFRSIG